MNIKRLDSDFVAEFDELDKWLEEKGITQRNRFRMYRANFTEMNESEKKKGGAQTYSDVVSRGRLYEMLSTFSEGSELVTTLSTLRSHKIDVPVELLKTALGGPADASVEDHRSNKARNALFELAMSAMIARNGLRPLIGQVNPDIMFEFGGRSVKMECKRVMSENKVHDRIKEGIEQLSKTVSVNTADIGIVAISIARLIHQGDRVAVGSEPHKLLDSALQSIVKTMEQRLASLSQPCVSAVLFYLSCPFYVPGVGYTTAASGLIFPMNPVEGAYLRTLCGLFTI
jgi:hypothetical protein